jgi:hypothetical protein
MVAGFAQVATAIQTVVTIAASSSFAFNHSDPESWSFDCAAAGSACFIGSYAVGQIGGFDPPFVQLVGVQTEFGALPAAEGNSG